MLRKEAWIAIVGALTIAGCSGGGNDEVLARVGSERVTVSDVDAELKMNGVARTSDPAVRRAALEQIVNRKLFAQDARARRLHNNAEAQAIQKATTETFQASLARSYITREVKNPTPAEVAAFIEARPRMFAGRTAYLVERIRAQGAPDPALVEALKPTQTLEAAEAVLKARNIPYRRMVDELDTLRIPPQVADSLDKLAPGEPFVLPEPGGFSVGRVRDRRVRPIAGAEATAIASAVIVAERRSKALGDRMKAMRAEKVRYAEAPAKAAVKAPGAPSAQAPSTPSSPDPAGAR